MDWIISDIDVLWKTGLSVILMFFVIILFTRIIGLRSFAKFTTFDFAFTVAIGSCVATTITSSTSIAQGSVAIAGLLGLTALTAALQRKYYWIDKIISNEPLLLMDGKEILEENLKSARVSHGQVMAKLREANVLEFGQVRAVVLETTGDISVLHTIDENQHIADEIMESVRRKP